ncbi:hypothetical protein [Streptosporangium roseum]|uniref:hypothetical protein n=1 Tax=Streptosporangium roseum TaxID=2001 RepID=UPI0004CD63E8|nr:hypothetical protein [Streptosporangium roseum]
MADDVPDNRVHADQGTPGYTVPTRPDGWPDLLQRRPLSSTERARLRARLEAEPTDALDAPGPFLCYLTVDGLDHEADPAKATRLRGRVHAAARTAAEHRHTTYHATDSTITIGIAGPDAQQRIDQLRTALAKLAIKHRWTLRDAPR